MLRRLLRTFSSSVELQEMLNWQKLAWEAQKSLVESEKERRQETTKLEKKYHREVNDKLRLEGRMSILQARLLRLQNNFNLRGALEFSLSEYKTTYNIPEMGQTNILQRLIKDTEYQVCLANVTKQYQLRADHVNACARTLYHELSKHAHGNTAELAVVESEHAITEVAAIEAVFCALKRKGCFRIPMKICLRTGDRQL